MAQLRDAKTSELIAEGTALEVALAAQQLGKAAVVGPDEKLAEDVEVIFDDVGAGFDPEATIAAHRENVDGLTSAAAAEKDPEVKGQLAAALEEAKAEADVAVLVDDAGQALDAARAKLPD